MDLHGKVALVTGSGVRVGRAIALGLSREGATIAVHYNSSAKPAAEVVHEITAAGGNSFAFEADLSKADSVETLIADVTQHFGRLDLLVNSAASMEATPIDTVSVDDWERIMTLNLRAPFFLSLAAAKRMQGPDASCAIVNISDLAAFETWPDYVVHGIAKAGIVTMTHSLAKLLAPRVRVNCIAPGAVMLPKGWPARSEREIIESTPLHRIGSPDDVAQAVVYLAQADYVTGETIFVDGGRNIRR
jgi:pteridine reductase